MIKTLFISLNLVGLIMLPFLYVGDVSVEHVAPSEVEAGNSVEVTITIKKGAVTGPARLKLDFSDAEGISAEDIENAGASFSFTGEHSMYIWYSIQPAETVTVKYRLSADAAASGTKTITGTFSYLDEEERKKIEVPAIIIEVTGGAVASTPAADAESTDDASVDSAPGGEDVAATVSTPDEDPIEEDPIEEDSQTADATTDVTCSRTVVQDGDDFLVTIEVHKGANHGFARIKEQTPEGFDAESVENASAVFKFVDNTAKFLWTSLPADKETIVVKYRLKPTTANPGDYQVDGVFSGEFLIVDDRPKSITIPTGYFTLESGGALAVDTNDGNGDVDTSDANDNTSDGTEVKSASNDDADNNDTADTSDSGSDNTTISTGNSNISYKVQVLAAHRTVSNSYIKRHYGYTGSIATENHEGWVKYTTGSFEVYKQARNKRNDLKSYTFPGPFVTAYNQGNRITVQEALMVSNQDWVQ